MRVEEGGGRREEGGGRREEGGGTKRFFKLLIFFSISPINLSTYLIFEQIVHKSKYLLSSGDCTIKLLTTLMKNLVASVCDVVSHFHPCLIFEAIYCGPLLKCSWHFKLK
jgi:hypothetical protein